MQGEEQVARYVRQMFDGVAPRYDLLNHLLSFQVDKLWRRHTVRRLDPILKRPDALAMDLCCGSGDLLIALQARCKGRVIGSDFSHQMLRVAGGKIASARLGSPLVEADALRLPVRDGALDLVTVSFGFRNFANYRKGLEEMLRVLKPGGTAAILEFSTPPNAMFRAVYQFYSTRVLPKIGAMLSDAPEAYTYLPESVRKFPDAPALAAEMSAAGFREVTFERMTFGSVALHLGKK